MRRTTFPKNSSPAATAILVFGLVANLAPLLTYATTLREIALAWGLSAGQSGWIGGIYFAGYAAAVPVMGSAGNRFDGRRLYLASAVLGGAASFAFAIWAHGFLLAMVLRFAGGVAFAGVHMPGLKLLVDRVAPTCQARAAALYTCAMRSAAPPRSWSPVSPTPPSAGARSLSPAGSGRCWRFRACCFSGRRRGGKP